MNWVRGSAAGAWPARDRRQRSSPRSQLVGSPHPRPPPYLPRNPPCSHLRRQLLFPMPSATQRRPDLHPCPRRRRHPRPRSRLSPPRGRPHPGSRAPRWLGRSGRDERWYSNTCSNPRGCFRRSSVKRSDRAGVVLKGARYFACNVGREIPNVDNFRPLWTGFWRTNFSCAQAVDAKVPGRNGLTASRTLISTVVSPCCAQRWRRVCTGYPQACAQQGWTSAAAPARLSEPSDRTGSMAAGAAAGIRGNGGGGAG